jgi:hypothetical protein
MLNIYCDNFDINSVNETECAELLKTSNPLDKLILSYGVISTWEIGKFKGLINLLPNELITELSIFEKCFESKRADLARFLIQNYKVDIFDLRDMLTSIFTNNDRKLTNLFFEKIQLSQKQFKYALQEAILYSDEYMIRKLALLNKGYLIQDIFVDGDSLVSLRKTYLLYLLHKGIRLFSDDDLDVILTRLDSTPLDFVTRFTYIYYKESSLRLMSK